LLYAALTGADAPSSQPTITELVRGLNRASYLYLDEALRFTSKEKIVEWGSASQLKVHSYDYLFVYDKDKGFQDYRSTGSGKHSVQVNLQDERVHLYLERAYMWVLIFNRTRLDHYRYRIRGSEKLQDIDTIQVEFEPIPPYQNGLNDWTGTAWVDPATYQIVKVEAMKRRDIKEKEKMEKETEEFLTSPKGEGSANKYRIEKASTEFSVVKNGMRFPGSAEIVSTLYYLPYHPNDLKPQVVTEDHARQTYSHYRFYGVRTSEQIRDILRPKQESTSPPP
jgi:hypothetical protein